MDPGQVADQLEELARCAQQLAECQTRAVVSAVSAITAAVTNGHKVLLFGNGGSAAQAQHMAAELVGRFRRERRPIAAIALTTDTSVLTAIGNDYCMGAIFSRQISALGRPGDVAIAISTSGRSSNVLAGVAVANQLKLTTIGLTGGDGGQLADKVSFPIIVPSQDIARIQECHVAIGHILCDGVESALGTGSRRAVEPELATTSDNASKIKTLEELDCLRQRWRNTGQRVVWTNGCFDLLHAGHLHSLRAARRHGDMLVVGVNSDASVRRLKGPGRPIVPARDRAQLLAALDCVGAVILFDETTPETILARLKPDVHCKGREFAPLHGETIPEGRVVAEYGGRIEFLPMVPEVSTTVLIERAKRS